MTDQELKQAIEIVDGYIDGSQPATAQASALLIIAEELHELNKILQCYGDALIRKQ